MKNAVFWDVTQFRSCVNRRFGGTSLHIRSTRRQILEDSILNFNIILAIYGLVFQMVFFLQASPLEIYMHLCFIPRVLHATTTHFWIDHSNNIWRRAKIMKLLITQPSVRCNSADNYLKYFYILGYLPCNLWKINRVFGGLCRLYLQGWKLRYAGYMLISCLMCSSTLKMKEIFSSEISIDF
jgi:hypothetical protein